MFATIRKHQKWLWLVIVAGVIVSFVIFFSPEQRVFRGRGQYSSSDVVGTIDGRPLSRQEYLEADKEARLRFRLVASEWPEESQNRGFFNEEREVEMRLLLMSKMRDLGIQVGDKAVADWIAKVFRDPKTGQFQLDYYNQLLKAVLESHGYTEADLRRFAQHEVGIQHLVALFGMSGELLTPQEAAAAYDRAKERVGTQVVFFWATNYLAKIKPDPNEVARYYTNNGFRYRIPERVQVAYVKFDATHYLAEAQTQMNQSSNLVESVYRERGTNSYPGLSPEMAKAKIRDELKKELALRQGRRKANEFTDSLFDMKPKRADNLEKLAAARGLLSRLSPPFTRSAPPPDLNAPSSFAQAAFSLTADEPFPEQPIVGEDAVYVIAFKKRIASELRPLSAVLARVTEDYRHYKAQELARNAGESFHQSVTNAIAHGTNFQTVAFEMRLPVAELPAVAQDSPPVPQAHGELPAILSRAFRLPVSGVNPFVPTRDGGFVFQVRKRLPPDPVKMKEELPKFTAELRRRRQAAAFDEWLQKQAQKSQLSIRGRKRETQAGSS